ncbi:MAG: hypothetical protein JO090_07900, partial [Rhizobacter sp.]|nr:hypothetical protein [Rhizobacter sp.]
MTPQDHFMVVAPVGAGEEAALRALLASMNSAPGLADPRNSLVPFGEFEQLHFARLALLDDALQVDLKVYGVEPKQLPTYLVFIGDCDGPADNALADLARRAGAGLARIFSHCQGFADGTDVLAWMRARDRRAAASFVNWVGRSVRQIREESALQRALSARVPRQSLATPADAQRMRAETIAYVASEVGAGRLVLTPPQPTPLSWQLRKLAHLIAVPMAGLLALPFLIVLAPFVAWRLRS